MPFTLNSYSTPSPAPSSPGSPSPSVLSPSPPVSQPSSPPSPVDADANIVLGDLVRSGEASRLRRRGAVRLDHARAAQSVSINSVSASRPAVSSTIHPSRFYGYASGSGQHSRFGTVTLEDFALRDPDGDHLDMDAYEHLGEHADEPTWTWPGAAGISVGSSNGRSLSGGALVQDELAAVADAQASNERFTLYCGAPLDLSGQTFSPPLFSWAQLPPISTPPTSGCGALVHPHALSRTSASAYSARCAAAPVVVPLEAEYAPPELASRAVTSSCGCARQVIGCSTCGNALGTRYVPCRAAANGLFAASACCKARSRDGELEDYMYTFDANAVHAKPAPSLPRPAPTPAPASETTPVIGSANRVRRISVQVTTETVQTGSSDDIVYTLLGPRVLFTASPESESPPSSPRPSTTATQESSFRRAGLRPGDTSSGDMGNAAEVADADGETDGDKTPGPTESVLPISWSSR